MNYKTILMLNGLLLEKVWKMNAHSISLKEGNLLNLFQIDSMKIGNSMLFFSDLISLPISFALNIYYLLSFDLTTGSAILIIGCIVIFLNFLVSLQFGRINKRLLKERDARMKVTNDIFEDIVNMKMLELEAEFLKQVST